ncbi:hypothetical protein U91I_00371 [alpha proteobacterium U9-1i]|nr:hypothetical protein U91I_00371 [alpha proteobacterium U9-1i]
MISFVLNRVRGLTGFLVVAASIAYGWYAIAYLPYWQRLVDAQGGMEIQTRIFYGAPEVAEAFALINPSDAFTFYALDVPNAILVGLGIAAMIAFGIRQLKLERSIARGLIALPLVASVSDLVETACLALALATNPGNPGFLGDAAGAFTTAKFAAGIPAQIAAVIGVVVGFSALAWRTLRPSAPPSPS